MPIAEVSTDSEVGKLLFLPLKSNDNIRTYWSYIRQALKELELTPIGVDGTREDVYTGILTSLMDQSMTCGLVFRTTEDGEVGPQGNLLGMVLYYFAEDISGPKNLIIFAMGVLGIMGPKDWTFAIESLQRLARSNGCDNILGQTKHPSVIKFVEALGGNAEYTLLEIPVGEE